jgi:tRNA threonylcarbamoyl adenosine modification protein (Sua5/YciO/YrdC/YwlC family)
MMASAAEVLRRGGLVVVPTDTVYGVAALAASAAAVDRLQAAKGRGDAYPPPILVADQAAAALLGVFTPAAEKLARAFWPGALTLVLALQPGAPVALAGDGTVGLRVPDHAGLRDLLAEAGPLACSSANRHDRPPATSVDQARAELGEAVALYVDGGPAGGVASTIVRCVGEDVAVLRVGRVSEAEIRRVADA